MEKPKTVYPDWIKSIRKDRNGKNYFYVLKVEECGNYENSYGHFFKFGITSSLHDRMRKHYRDFIALTSNYGKGWIIEQCAIIDCGTEAVMKRVESDFKNESLKAGILRDRYEKTEIIYLPGPIENIRNFIKWVQDKVKILQSDPESAKEVQLSEKIKNLQKEKLGIRNKIGVNENITIAIEEIKMTFRHEMDQLRLLHRIEIERLEKRIRELESKTNR